MSSRGKGELYYESGQRHVVSLAFDGQGRLLAGTDPNGILYRIESKRKAFALYDSDMPEIRNLQVTPEGAIFAAGVGGGYSSFGGDAGASVGTAQGAATTTITVDLISRKRPQSPCRSPAPKPAGPHNRRARLPFRNPSSR